MSTDEHVADKHAHALPDCFEKRPDVTWDQVHKLLHDLARKRGEDPHTREEVTRWQPST